MSYKEATCLKRQWRLVYLIEISAYHFRYKSSSLNLVIIDLQRAKINRSFISMNIYHAEDRVKQTKMNYDQRLKKL